MICLGVAAASITALRRPGSCCLTLCMWARSARTYDTCVQGWGSGIRVRAQRGLRKP